LIDQDNRTDEKSILGNEVIKQVEQEEIND